MLLGLVSSPPFLVSLANVVQVLDKKTDFGMVARFGVALARFALAPQRDTPCVAVTQSSGEPNSARSFAVRHYCPPDMLPSAAELVARFLRTNGYTEV